MIETLLGGSNISVLRSPLFSPFAEGLEHFITLRNLSLAEDPQSPYATLNLCDYTGDDQHHVDASRQRVATAIGIDPSRLWFPRQVHGTQVVQVDVSTPAGIEADAVITRVKGLAIGVSTADCVPILLCDAQLRAVAAIHAGWRGTVAGIVTLALSRFLELTGGSVEEVWAVVGPAISPEAFEVGPEVADAFARQGMSASVVSGYTKPHIDLFQANVSLLLSAGVPLEQVDCTPVCTYSNPDRLFSARRLGVASGRIASCIMLK